MTFDLVHLCSALADSRIARWSLMVGAIYQRYALLNYAGAGADAVGKIGGIQDILSSLRSFPLNADIGGSCCVALWGLSLGGETGGMCLNA